MNTIYTLNCIGTDIHPSTGYSKDLQRKELGRKKV